MKRKKPFAKAKRAVKRERWRISEKQWRETKHERTAKEIAEELGVTPQAVYRAAKRFGFADKLLKGHAEQPQKVEWESLPRVDWEMTNADLGRKHNVTREIVRRKRQRYAPADLKQSPRKG